MLILILKIGSLLNVSKSKWNLTFPFNIFSSLLCSGNYIKSICILVLGGQSSLRRLTEVFKNKIWFVLLPEYMCCNALARNELKMTQIYFTVTEFET